MPTEAFVWDIADSGSALIAIGQRLVDDTDVYPAAWFSDSGVTWTEAPLPHNGGGQVTALAGSPTQGYVAIGGDSEGTRIWYSTDGTAWKMADAAAALDPWSDGGPAITGEFCCGVYLADVALGPAGFMAVGHAGDSKSSPRAAILTSEDGKAWVRHPFSAVLDGGSMWSLVHTPALGWVANGSHAWASSDGLSWSRGDRFERAPLLLTTHRDQPIAADSWGGAIRASSDGLSWVRQDAHLEEREDVDIRHLISTDAGVVALGTRKMRAGSVIVLWLSEDGERWGHEIVLRDANVQSPPLIIDGDVVLYGSAPFSHALATEREQKSWSVPLAELTRAGPVTPSE